MTDLVFLSVPYTDSDPAVVERRVQLMLNVDAHLMRQGVFTISPVYKHLLVQANLQVPGTWEYWRDYCKTLLQRCDRMIIIPLPGWTKSAGVRGEIDIADELGVPYTVFDLQDLA